MPSPVSLARPVLFGDGWDISWIDLLRMVGPWCRARFTMQVVAPASERERRSPDSIDLQEVSCSWG